MAAFDLAFFCREREGSHHPLVPQRINQLARAGGHLFRETRCTPGNTLRLFAQQFADGTIACLAASPGGRGAFRHRVVPGAAAVVDGLIERVYRQLIDETRDELDLTDDAVAGPASPLSAGLH